MYGENYLQRLHAMKERLVGKFERDRWLSGEMDGSWLKIWLAIVVSAPISNNAALLVLNPSVCECSQYTLWVSQSM
jgi:hypothetical protein